MIVSHRGKANERRRGMAPLEFILVLPLLMSLCYGMFIIVKTSLRGLSVVEEARYESFRKLPPTLAQKPLVLLNPAMDGVQTHAAQSSVTYDLWWSNVNAPVNSKVKTQAGTWDERSVPFPPRQGRFQAHSQPVSLIQKNTSMLPALETTLKVFGTVMNMPGNPVIAALAATAQVMDIGVRVSGIFFTVTRPVLYVIRGLLQIARIAAIASFHFRFARFLGRCIRLLGLGIDAFAELPRAAEGKKIRWRGINVSGAFP